MTGSPRRSGRWPRRGGRHRHRSRPRPAPRPPHAAPIPLQATGPGSRPASRARPAAPSAPEPPRDTPAPATAGITGDRPPLSEPELGPLPAADPAALDELVPDTALDGARYGSLTLLAASQRGDLARHRGDVRRDALLTARFGVRPSTP